MDHTKSVLLGALVKETSKLRRSSISHMEYSMSGLVITNRAKRNSFYRCPLCSTKLLIAYLMSDKRKVCYHCACRIVKDTQHNTYIVKTIEAEF